MPVTTRDITLNHAGDDFVCRVYEPVSGVRDRPALIWAHGGAFMFGGIDSVEAHEPSQLLAEQGVVVVSVDYRLAPVRDMPFGDPHLIEGPASSAPRRVFPVARDEFVVTFDWLLSNAAELGVSPTKVHVGGASAGGALCASAALALRDRGSARPASIVLAYPVLHERIPSATGALAEALDELDPSFRFVESSLEPMWASYTGQPDGSDRSAACPGGQDLHDLPPTMILNSDIDWLRLSGEAFAGELAIAGVDVYQVREPGTTHGHLSVSNGLALKRSMKRIGTWLEMVDSLT